MEIVRIFFTTVIPIGLIIIMTGMGLSLTVNDLKRVIFIPKAAMIGLFGQLLLLPALAFTLVAFFSPSSVTAVGIIILAACPGGVTSNAYVFASRADVALSVTLTGMTSIVTVFTIPLLTYLALQIHFQSGDIPELQIIKMISKLATLTILPIAGGMLIRTIWPDFASKLVGPMRKIALALLIILILGGAIMSIETIRSSLLEAGGIALALNLLSMCMGYAIARYFHLSIKQTITITYELGVQNIAVALTVIYTILEQPPLAVTILIYALIMKATALGFLVIARRLLAKQELNN